jgi:hypothetical protein
MHKHACMLGYSGFDHIFFKIAGFLYFWIAKPNLTGNTTYCIKRKIVEHGYWTELQATCRSHRNPPQMRIISACLTVDCRGHLNVLLGDFFLYIWISLGLEPY